MRDPAVVPICKIAQENGGDVPLACLFDCHRGCKMDSGPPRQEHCNRCGATDVRWRQQGGKWVLFSLKPGVLHQCPIVDNFAPVKE